MSEKKVSSKQEPEKSIRVGDVIVDVSLRTTNTGFEYRDLVLGRAWRTASGKEIRSNSFFADSQTEADIIEAVRRAMAYIKSETQASTPSLTDAMDNTKAETHEA